MAKRGRKREASRQPATVRAGTSPAKTTPAVLAAVAVVLALLAIVIYSQTASFGFVDLDDTGYVVVNPHVTSGLTPENLQWAFTSTYAANWHPLTWISHQLDVSLFGVNAGRLHLMNLMWHVMATLLLFGCLRSMTGSLWRSAFVAAAFAAHPAHVESVAWIAERKDVLSAALWFATTWAYVVWARRRSAGTYALALICFGLGLMAKPMLVTLPFTLLLLDYWPLNRSAGQWRQRFIEKIPFFALAAVSSVLTTIAQQKGGAVGSLGVIPIGERLANAVLSYGRYLKVLAWPFDLTVLYPYPRPVPVGAALMAASVLLALSVLAWRTRRTQPSAIVGWLWFLGTMVPVIGLVQVGSQAMADRYTYIPSVGIFIAVAWGAESLARRVQIPRAVPIGIGAAAVIAWAIVAHQQTEVWASTETLWRHAVDVVPQSARAHNSLGAVYGKTGRTAEAAEQFKIAAGLQLDVETAQNVFPNLGRALMAQGKVAEALPYLERARQVSPERADVWHQLGLAYFGADRKDDALNAWKEAVRLDPRSDDTFFMMGVVFAADGHLDDARRAFTQVLAINPSRQDARDMLKALGK